MAAAASHSNKTAWHITSRFVRYLSSSHTIRMIYQISYTYLIICRLSASFRSCIHCIATRVAMRVVKGSQFSPRSSIFHFEFRSQMNLVSSLFFFRINHKILRSIQWYKLFSDQPKNKEVRILSKRCAILKWLSHAKYVQKSGPRCNKFVIRFMADLPRNYRGSVVNIVGLGSASPHHDHNWPPIFS